MGRLAVAFARHRRDAAKVAAPAAAISLGIRVQRLAPDAGLRQTKAKLFTDAGLPEDAEKFWGLLLFLDLYVLLARLPAGADCSAASAANAASA